MIDYQISVQISHTVLVHLVSFVLMLLLLPSFYHCCCRRRVRFCDSGEGQISDHHHHHLQGEWQIADHHQGADTVIFSSCKFFLYNLAAPWIYLSTSKFCFCSSCFLKQIDSVCPTSERALSSRQGVGVENVWDPSGTGGRCGGQGGGQVRGWRPGARPPASHGAQPGQDGAARKVTK